MANYLLKLVSISAVRQQERSGDEPMININGSRVYSGPGDALKTGGTLAINRVFTVGENTGARTEFSVFERDLGNFLDNHDFIQRKNLSLGQLAGKGERAVDFTGDGAQYTLRFSVAIAPDF